MTSIPWYNVIFNYKYIQDFAYIPVNVEDRHEYIECEEGKLTNFYEQSDIVTILLYLPFIDKSTIKDFQIKDDWARHYFGKENIA